MSPKIQLYSRLLAPRLRESLADTPAVLIHGPRQSGKTTLARSVGEPRGYRYVSFDDEAIRRAAQNDPIGFVAGLPKRAILDEVQRVPEIFTSLKSVIDNGRSAGRFILTGSANVLLIPKLADSLAGRMDYCAYTRWRNARWLRRAWYRDLVETQIQRDVRDVTRVHSFDALPRLLAMAANHTARLINISDLAAPFQLSRQTIHDYVTVLERIFLLERLAPWHNNRLSRLVKTPKLHIGDTGLACALMAIDAATLLKERERLGPLLETFVLQELRRQTSWRPDPIEFFHYRDRDDFEVDIVLEFGSSAVAGVEVKAAATVVESDFRGLRKLREAAAQRFRSGVVLYDGTASVSFGDGLFAVPLRHMWESR
jgi:uncharacterized protein